MSLNGGHAPIEISDEDNSFVPEREKRSELIAWGGEKNFENEKTFLVEPSAEEQDLELSHLEVFLRLNGSVIDDDTYKINANANSIECKIPPESHAGRNLRKDATVLKAFEFTRIFDCKATQRDIFNGIVRKKLLSFIDGNSASILTYGVSGAGKTYTLLGTDDEPGVIPRSLYYLFKILAQYKQNEDPLKLQPSKKINFQNAAEVQEELALNERMLRCIEKCHHAHTFRNIESRLSTEPISRRHYNVNLDSSCVTLGIWVSFAEIYNEYAYDLLTMQVPHTTTHNAKSNFATARPKLKLSSDSWGDQYINNLSMVRVHDFLEAYHVLQFGIKNLQFASTDLNVHSSRSHSIYTVYLVQFKKDNGSTVNCSVNTIRFLDLAGAERAKKSHNKGTQLQESGNINSSLLVLGRCISQALKYQQKKQPINRKRVPFRESKLTRLLQNALVGDELLTMIISINPSKEQFDETQHTLNFSAIAKQMRVNTELIKPIQQLEAVSEAEKPSSSDIKLLTNYMLDLESLVLSLQMERDRIEIETRKEVCDYYNNLLQKQADGWTAYLSKLKLQSKKMFDMKVAKLLKGNQPCNSNDNENVVVVSSDSEVDKCVYISSTEEDN